MSMITDLVEKLAPEVEDSNVLIIEDVESAKKITIGELKKVFRPVQERFVKEIINETIDRITERLLEAKWEFTDYITKTYKMNTWIGSASGNIQISLLDTEINKWLTREEIEELLKNQYSIKVYIGSMWEEPVSIRVLSFCEEHEDPESINEWMAADDAGFIKIHLDGLTNNQISQIIYEDIEITMVDNAEENIRYEFIYARDSFANAVPYEAKIPGCCPCCSHKYPMQQPDVSNKEPEQKPAEGEQEESPVEPELPTEPEEPENGGEESSGENSEEESGSET